GCRTARAGSSRRLRTWRRRPHLEFLVMLDMAGLVPRMTPAASLLRRRNRHQHGHDVVAAIDDFAAFVRTDEAGIIGREHGLLAADDERELACEHIVDLFRGRGVGAGAAAW